MSLRPGRDALCHDNKAEVFSNRADSRSICASVCLQHRTSWASFINLTTSAPLLILGFAGPLSARLYSQAPAESGWQAFLTDSASLSHAPWIHHHQDSRQKCEPRSTTMQARTGRWMRMSCTLWRSCWTTSARKTRASGRRRRQRWMPSSRLAALLGLLHDPTQHCYQDKIWETRL